MVFGIIPECRSASFRNSVQIRLNPQLILNWSHPPESNRRPTDYESVMCCFDELMPIDIHLYYQ
jgi:hypothetical protein